MTQSQNASNTFVTSPPVAGTVTHGGSITVTSSPVAGTVTHAGSIAVISPPITGIVTQSLDSENVIVASSPVTGTVTWSQHASCIIVTSSPAAPTTIHAGSIIITSPIALTVTQKVTTLLGTPTTSASPLADYLVHPVQKTTPNAPKRSVPRARLLTSDESLALLEQKENTKKMALPSKNGLARNMQILKVFFLQDLQDLTLNFAHILQVLH